MENQLLIITVSLCLCLTDCTPQLDLPPVPTPSVDPKVTVNTYSEPNQTVAQTDYDRSLQPGPPYDDNPAQFLNRSARYRDDPDDRYDTDPRRRDPYYYRDRDCTSPDCDRNYNYDRNRNYNSRDRDCYGTNCDRGRDYERDRYPYNRDNNCNGNPDCNQRPYTDHPYNDNRDYYNRNRDRDYNRDQNNNRDPNYNRDSNYNRDYDRNRPYNDYDRNRPYNGYNNGYNNNNNQNGYDRNRPNYGSDYDRNRDPNYPQRPYPYDERDRYNDDYYPNGFYDIQNDPKYREEIEALRRRLDEIDRKSSLECNQNVAAQWNFETNVNEATHLEAVAAQQRYSDFQRALWEEMRKTEANRIYDNELYRQVRLMSVIGVNALPPDQLDRYNRIVNDQLAIYNTAEICAYEQPFKCGLRLQPHLKTIMAKSRDWDELQYTWLEWRRKTGRQMRELFEQMVELTNQAANHNNFSNAADYWQSAYDSPTFRSDMELVWREIEPLYELLHSYIRRKLREYYGPDKINRYAPIPDHILGNMYGQSWSNILDITLPYPGRRYLEVTPEMEAQGYNPLVMFQLADEFYRSMNMTALPPKFWVDSVLDKPPDRPILCQPSAWDFCNGNDYRIKMCTQVNHKDLITVHHEVAHIHYFLNYKNKPKVFRDGPNPSFHEAIGDAIGLSVASPRHLQTLGLVQKSVDDTGHDINFLFSLAMDKVVFLPFALSLEFWRYDIFSKRIRKEQYNCHWWLLREQYGGIKPPVLRSELDFDMGSKYHVPANIPYIRHFFGAVLQFQIFRSLCLASREYVPGNPDKPLHKCDIYRHPEAGDILKRLMEKGSSDTWQNVLRDVLGENRLDASAVREYFRPLEEWLRSENNRNQEPLGWRYDGDYCKHSIETANLQVYGGFYNGASILSSQFFYVLILSAILLSVIK